MKGLLIFCLTLVVCFAFTHVSADAQAAYRISAPYTYKNLTIFLIHGEDSSSNTNLITLQEALEMKIFKVYETEDVNELTVENISPKYDVFIQSGDIVKGGKQDRVLAISIIVPRNSGKVSIEAFCVEAERWSGRGNESRKEFSSSEERIVSKELKLATIAGGTASGSGSGNGVGSGSGSGSGTASGSGSGSGNGVGDGDSAGVPPPMANSTGAVLVRGSQSAVWNEVSVSQANISRNVSVDVTANSSASSLQLSLENKKLKKAREAYERSFLTLLKDKKDVIGYAFAINGEINSADIYLSNHLFTRLWPKMVKAAVTEAISLADKPQAGKGPLPADIQAFLSEAEKGIVKERPTVANSKVVAREAKNEAVFEMRDKADTVIHRNYVKLN